MNDVSVRIFASLLAVLSYAALSLAGGPVRVSTADGRTIEGLWQGLDKDKVTVSVDDKSTPLSSAELMSIHMIASTSAPAAASEPADRVRVYLAEGSQFDATIIAGMADSVELRTELVASLKLRISSVAAIRFSHQENAAAAAAFTQALEQRDSLADTLFIVQEGKVSPLRGVLQSLDDRGGSFKWRERNVNIDRTRAYGVVLAKGAGAAVNSQVQCSMTDGSTWAGTLAAGDDRSIKLQLAAGPAVDVPLSRITDIRFHNARVVFLSDLEPSKYEFTPWGTTRWPYRKDRSVADRPMSIGSRLFDRGIGVHSKSLLTYTLTEPFQQFAATIGLDDAVGARGNVVFRVMADDKEVFNSGPVKGGDAGKPVLVALNGAKMLQLVVEFGDDLDVADQADWGAARLIK